MQYFKQVYFIYDKEGEGFVSALVENELDVEVIPLDIDQFIADITHLADKIEHIVLSVDISRFFELVDIAYKYNISIGIIPPPNQKEQLKNFYCGKDIDENIDIALRDNCKFIDLIQINDKLMYTNGVIGAIPLLDKNIRKPVMESFKNRLISKVKRFFSIRLQKFEITTANNKTITTAGSAVVILNNTNTSPISRVFDFDQSMCDGEITVVIISPFSIFEYFKLISMFALGVKKHKNLPESIGYVKSKSFSIKASKNKRIVFEDKTNISLPIECHIVKDAVKINANEKFWENNKRLTPTKETIKVSKLPDANEANKYITHKHIPFFKFASEERFKDLFQMLRSDAKINTSYIVLMIISTLLATVGLFANSTAVIIGAMLVAPLMTPIIALAMGLLRGEDAIIADSLVKIAVGILVALIASSSLAFLLPYSEMTSEMNNRINPTLLDLGIAILSGIAAAYSKSFKEIVSNLAGVAIAVALVPPLSVAGIGLGYGKFTVFEGAFLLFFTNLIGIVLSAVITFQILGFSSVLKSKKSIIFIFLLIVGVSYPLYLSYDKIIQRYQIAKMLKQHRFIVNNKYIIIKDVSVSFHNDIKIFKLTLLVRNSLNRDDLQRLKEDIQRLFNAKLVVQTQMEYIL